MGKEPYKLTAEHEKFSYGLWSNLLSVLMKTKVGNTIGIASLSHKYWLELKKVEEI